MMKMYRQRFNGVLYACDYDIIPAEGEHHYDRSFHLADAYPPAVQRSHISAATPEGLVDRMGEFAELYGPIGEWNLEIWPRPHFVFLRNVERKTLETYFTRPLETAEVMQFCDGLTSSSALDVVQVSESMRRIPKVRIITQ